MDTQILYLYNYVIFNRYLNTILFIDLNKIVGVKMVVMSQGRYFV